MAEEYKALTYINLPFLDGNGRLYLPGQTIPLEAFEESASAAASEIGEENETVSAEDMIADLIQWGSLSDDPDAELNPAHIPVEPGTPTITGLVEQAKFLVNQMNERGEEVPEELQLLAESRELVNGADSGSGGDVSA